MKTDPTPPKHPGKVKGWLEEDDPFFAVIDEIVEARFQHQPRAVSSHREGDRPAGAVPICVNLILTSGGPDGNLGHGTSSE